MRPRLSSLDTPLGAAEGGIDDDARDRMENTTSYWMNTWGYMRYFDKRERS